MLAPILLDEDVLGRGLETGEKLGVIRFAVIIIITTRASERRVFSQEQKQTNYHINEMSLKVSDRHLSPHGALGLVCLADWLGSCPLLPLLLHEGLSGSCSIHQGGQPSPTTAGPFLWSRISK